MGSFISKIKKTPYEILEIEKTATLQEIAAKYKKLIFLNHPDLKKNNITKFNAKTTEINDAYNEIMTSPPVFECYTEELLKVNLNKYATDFFIRVSKYSKINAPRFDSEDFEIFYNIFKNFTNVKVQFETKEEKSKFCGEVRRVARLAYSLDNRIYKEDVVKEVKIKIEKKPKEKKEKIYPFKCDNCNKGFHSTNQLVNHLNSKKHFNKIAEEISNPEEYVSKQIGELVIDIDEEKKPNVELEGKAGEYNTDLLENSKEKSVVKKFATEPAPFRTCSYCKKVFESRSELFVHIKSLHAD